MGTRVDALAVRRSLGLKTWRPPVQFGPQGWRFDAKDGDARVIVTCSDLPNDDREWVHASISRLTAMPSYEDLVDVHRAVWGPTGHAYQCFVPDAEHINIHAHALHLWGLRDGSRVLPDFGLLGTI